MIHSTDMDLQSPCVHVVIDHANTCLIKLVIRMAGENKLPTSFTFMQFSKHDHALVSGYYGLVAGMVCYDSL